MKDALAFLGETVFDHVGVAVRSINDLAEQATVVDDPTQRVSVAFVDLGGLRVELIQPLGSASPVEGSLERGQRLVHLCFRVPDLRVALGRARDAGFTELAAPTPAPAFAGRCIAWIFSRSVGLIELVEEAYPAERAID